MEVVWQPRKRALEVYVNGWRKKFITQLSTDANTIGKYEGAIREYIRNQLQEDIADDQLSLKEFVDPFTGEKAKKA